MRQRINFIHLQKKFKSKVVAHFIITFFWTILNVLLVGSITELFRKEKIGSDFNYKKILIPEIFRQSEWVKKIQINKEQFIWVSLIFIFIYAYVCYLNYLWEEELRIKGEHYTKNLLLNKFRKLTFEERSNRKEEIVKLVENDSSEIGWYWEHLPNHIFHSFLEIIFLTFFYSKNLTSNSISFFLIWLLLLNIINYFFTQKNLRNEKEYKKALDKEWSIINKERSNVNLISSMGLSDEYKLKQEKVTRGNEKFRLKLSNLKSLSKSFPNDFLMNLFPFLLLILIRENFNGIILVTLWSIFNKVADIFKCLWDYADYASSRERINYFLNLSERNDNLNGIKLENKVEIKKIKMESVYFSYRIKKKGKYYKFSFPQGKMNYLKGENGSGKSTTLNILLGNLKPQKGKVIIELNNGKNYDLYEEINLDFWRKNNVVYLSHLSPPLEENENLSTGQKQLSNIFNQVENKKTAQIFLFDESGNALDVENKLKFQVIKKQLVKNNKIVIDVEH